MVIRVDAASGVAQMVDRDDFKSFKIVVSAASPTTRESLQQAFENLGRLDGDFAWVSPQRIVDLVGQQPDQWHRSFEEMCEYAASKGWVDSAGDIRAHIEWEIDVETADADTFRRVLGHFPTGVAVVTADTPKGPVGMACNSLTSVSLSPPLIALCPARSSETWPLIRDTGKFLINVMASPHEEVTRRFAKKDVDRFDGVAVHTRKHGIGLDEAVAWIECRIEAEHDAGDHTIVIGRVLHLDADPDPDPLVFFRGQYGTFRAGV